MNVSLRKSRCIIISNIDPHLNGLDHLVLMIIYTACSAFMFRIINNWTDQTINAIEGKKNLRNQIK